MFVWPNQEEKDTMERTPEHLSSVWTHTVGSQITSRRSKVATQSVVKSVIDLLVMGLKRTHVQHKVEEERQFDVDWH